MSDYGYGLWLDLTHDGGHLRAKLIGWDGDPHVSPFHLVSYLLRPPVARPKGQAPEPPPAAP